MTTAIRNVPFARPWITDEDRAAVLGVLQGSVLTHGPQCAAFEEEFGRFLGEGAHCVTVSSCMAALHLAYLQEGIGPGDEVLVPAQTHTATAHAVEWVGAKPVFVDCDPRTGCLDPEGAERAVTPRTRALSLVHFAGIPCDMDRILAVAERHRLRVIEDCALALGARIRGKHVGLFGDAGCFSFYPAKHITTAEGGMFVTRHRAVAEKVARLRAFGVDRTHGERSLPGMYDVPTLGLNYRMSEIQAALGRGQIGRFSENLSRRNRRFQSLRAALQKVAKVRVLDSRPGDGENSHYCLSLVLEGARGTHRDAVLLRLKEAGIGASIYYPHPVPRMKYYREKYGYDRLKYPSAEEISDHSLALPVGPHLDDDDAAYLEQQVVRILNEVTG